MTQPKSVRTNVFDFLAFLVGVVALLHFAALVVAGVTDGTSSDRVWEFIRYTALYLGLAGILSALARIILLLDHE